MQLIKKKKHCISKYPMQTIHWCKREGGKEGYARWRGGGEVWGEKMGRERKVEDKADGEVEEEEEKPNTSSCQLTRGWRVLSRGCRRTRGVRCAGWGRWSLLRRPSGRCRAGRRRESGSGTRSRGRRIGLRSPRWAAPDTRRRRSPGSPSRGGFGPLRRIFKNTYSVISLFACFGLVEKNKKQTTRHQ